MTSTTTNEGTLRRTFIHFNRAWYAEANQPTPWADEVHVGIERADGSGSGFSIAWYPLSRNLVVPKLEVFNDAWAVLAEAEDLVRALGDLDDQSPGPEIICAMLEQLGFEDATPEERPR